MTGAQDPSRWDQEGVDLDRRRFLHRLYRHRITWVIILVCCGLFIGGIWISGFDMDQLAFRAAMFNPRSHICLRESWLETTRGEFQRVKLCTEWIDTEDLTGRTHVMAIEKLEIFEDADGKIRAHVQRGINYALLTMVLYLGAILIGGRWVQTILIHRHRRHMGLIL